VRAGRRGGWARARRVAPTWRRRGVRADTLPHLFSCSENPDDVRANAIRVLDLAKAYIAASGPVSGAADQHAASAAADAAAAARIAAGGAWSTVKEGAKSALHVGGGGDGGGLTGAARDAAASVGIGSGAADTPSTAEAAWESAKAALHMGGAASAPPCAGLSDALSRLGAAFAPTPTKSTWGVLKDKVTGGMEAEPSTAGKAARAAAKGGADAVSSAAASFTDWATSAEATATDAAADAARAVAGAPAASSDALQAARADTRARLSAAQKAAEERWARVQKQVREGGEGGRVGGWEGVD